ncbi:MAG: DinB family protein [Bacteroidota bacterium]
MDPAHWNEELASLTKDYQAALRDLNPQLFNRKPNPKQWSIAQVLQHLIQVNRSYFEHFDRIKQGNYQAPWLSKLGFWVKFFSRTVLNAVKPDTQRKTKTFGPWEPIESELSLSVIDRFFQQQEQLSEQLDSLLERADLDQIIASPISQMIVYPLERAVEIVLVHERRHLLQLRRVREQVEAN